MALSKKRFTGGIVVEKASARSSGLTLKTDNASTMYTLSVPNTGVSVLEVTLPDTGTVLLSETSTQTISNKALDVTTTSLVDVSNTKVATLSLSQAASTTTAYALPAASDTLVGRLSTDTLTNKSISGLVNTITDLSTSSFAPLAANFSLITNPSGVIVAGTVTSVELARLSGITSQAVGVSDIQVITNKDIDIGTESNTSRLTIGKNTKTALDALTRKEATLTYGTDTKQLYIDDGTTLLSVGGSWTSYASQVLVSNDSITLSLTTGLQYRRVTGTAGATAVSLTPFGLTAPPDGTVVRLVGQSNTDSVVVSSYDAAKGALINGLAELGYADVLELQYDSVLDRWVETFRNF
jgi:hypothetical protein